LASVAGALFVEAASEEEIAEAAAWAGERRLRCLCWRGSNLLVSDAGFDGLVLRWRCANYIGRCAG